MRKLDLDNVGYSFPANAYLLNIRPLRTSLFFMHILFGFNYYSTNSSTII